MIRAILFDMDGLLVDSEPVHAKNAIQALERQGVKISEKDFYAHWTRDGKTIHHFAKERAIPVDVPRYRQDKREAYPGLVKAHLKPMEGAAQKVRELAGHYKLALVSASTREEVRIILEHVGLADAFEVVLSCDDVQNPKPAPDAFLLAAERLGVKPGECLVLEDAWKGVEAAAAAGMKAVAIPCDYTKDNDFSKADKVLSSLRKLTPEMIDKL